MLVAFLFEQYILQSFTWAPSAAWSANLAQNQTARLRKLLT